MSTIEELIISEVVKQVVSDGLRRTCTHDQVADMAATAVKSALAALAGERGEESQYVEPKLVQDCGLPVRWHSLRGKLVAFVPLTAHERAETALREIGALGGPLYLLAPNQGERPDPSAAGMKLREILDHYWETVET